MTTSSDTKAHLGTAADARSGLHVAVIMDGNGRWAERRGLPRTLGHLQGAKTVSRVISAATENPVVRTLTLYAFSSDNWGRPQEEVKALMGLLKEYLRKETSRCAAQGVRLNFIGRRDRLSPELLTAIELAEGKTCGCTRLSLRIAVDYSSRQALLAAARDIGSMPADASCFDALLEKACHSIPGVGPVDLLIRTGGEKRLSDFLLWECAYAELYFTTVLWPDFSTAEFSAALNDFATRQRRFGKLPPVRAKIA